MAFRLWDGISHDVEEEENQNVEPDIDKYIENAKSIKELGQIWNKYQPTDDAIKKKFAAKRGELQ